MPLEISTAEARRFLATYHLRPGTIDRVFEHLRTIQYDPLNPVGRNPDLVLQARVPDYRVDDWQQFAYQRRLAYDTWDKQACLVPVQDWPNRARVRTHHLPWHDAEILEQDPEAVSATLEQIRKQGPMSSLDFEDRSTTTRGHSWLGASRAKRILRALWARGELVTHHREGTRHYYDLPERIIPPEIFNQPALLDAPAFYRWIVMQRHHAVGLLRPNAEAAVWSACGDPDTRRQAIRELVEEGKLQPVLVGDKRTLYHMPAVAAPLLGQDIEAVGMKFLGPLDSLIWDRKAVTQIFGFDYLWEVYKPERLRLWGYYVLPVFVGDRFVARFDSRRADGAWTLMRWWWEPDVELNSELLEAVTRAAREFLAYLGVGKIRVSRSVSKETAEALRAAAKKRVTGSRGTSRP